MIFRHLIISILLLISCDTGKLTVVADIPNHLKEVSATEITTKSDLIWVIEDAGNDNHLYGLDENGIVKKDLTVLNSENVDWEDLTSDAEGSIYIGDFGNNSNKRKNFVIYKVLNPENGIDKIQAESINFELPETMKSENFEAFFLYKKSFYLFSKGSKECVLIKVPNKIGNHTAELITEFSLDGKKSKVTSADISDDGKTIVLLNHDKLWKLTNYKRDNFFEGTIEEVAFGHNSQKEGICFKNDSTLYITDENNGSEGSNLYSFKL